MLSREEFDGYVPDEDVYAGHTPPVITGDLTLWEPDRIKLSILISTWNRRGQLAVSLECLARQTWRDFEVLLNDDGSTEDIESLAEQFGQYMPITFFRSARASWRSCPSRAFKMMLPRAAGDIMAIMHPEMMLSKGAAWALYHGAIQPLPGAHEYVIDGAYPRDQAEWRWVSLKPNFFDDALYARIDEVDWHADVDNLRLLPGYGEAGGFAGQKNPWHATRQEYLWWFVGAARRDCPIWADMPTIAGHGILDMWLCHYRRDYPILDVVPRQVLCYHQPHLTSAIAPEGEQAEVTPWTLAR